MNTNEPTLAPAFGAYLAEQSRWAPTTQKLCRRWLIDLQHFLTGQDLSWDRATAAHLREFEAHLQWGGHRQGLYSANTIYQALRMIRAFYRWAFAQRLMLYNPTRNWILPRPRDVEERLLTEVELLQLQNLPDLTTPMGQRDALLLALLIYGNYSLERCMHLPCTELDAAERLHPTLKSAYERYFRQGRPASEHPVLLLTEKGQPMKTCEGFRQRLWALGQRIGLPQLSARILRKSQQAHQDELSKRRGPLL